jgi:biopolymer transport protein ExbB
MKHSDTSRSPFGPWIDRQFVLRAAQNREVDHAFDHSHPPTMTVLNPSLPPAPVFFHGAEWASFWRAFCSKAWPLWAVLLLCWPLGAQAWWNAEFKQRTKITLNTSANGVELREALSGTVVPVRLHSGNFDFLAAKPDGADLRVVAGDDKTPLKFTVERFDSTNELAVLWVQVPALAPGSAQNNLYVYAGSEKASSEAPAVLAEPAAAAVFHFADPGGSGVDHTGTLRADAQSAVEPNGLIGASARLKGVAMRWPANERVTAAAGGAYTVNLWVKPENLDGTLFAQGPLSLRLVAGKPTLSLGSTRAAGGALPPTAWAHLVLTVAAGKGVLYVNGAQAAQFEAGPTAPAIEGPFSVGEGFTGLVDELQVATTARSAEWVKFTHAAQSADARLVAALKQTPGSEEGASEGGHGGYLGVLVKNLTVDGWVVIGLCGLLFLIAVWVMLTKARFVSVTDRGNRSFLNLFRDAQDVLSLGGAAAHPHSSIARLYDAGCRELKKREVGTQASGLSGASLNAVKAAVDADAVRESHRLNAHMVWLTIAISGGPFLGLLGTVVGVMITFAAIAAAGDVNVNAIAPGIAAALLATVAGLGVAIPALFGYNYLSARMKNISADTQIFVDEFVTRVAENYGAR